MANGSDATPQRVAITGASGTIGSALGARLSRAGHTVYRLVRGRAQGEQEIRWDPAGGEVDAAALEGIDAVCHLAGEPLQGRWTETKKRAIVESRHDSTRLLTETIAGLEHPPRTLVCASAVGYYGSRGDEVLTEDSSAGDDFLAEVCQGWEAACEPARDAGIRVVNLRQGVVLESVLPKLRLPFKLGLGGRIGDGRQYWSWISLDDLVGAWCHAIDDAALSGPVNAVAPHPVTNAEFTRLLGGVLGRPTVIPLPAVVIRSALGELADGLLLASQRVQPSRLDDSGFVFEQPDLEGALRHALDG